MFYGVFRMVKENSDCFVSKVLDHIDPYWTYFETHEDNRNEIVSIIATDCGIPMKWYRLVLRDSDFIIESIEKDYVQKCLDEGRLLTIMSAQSTDDITHADSENRKALCRMFKHIASQYED